MKVGTDGVLLGAWAPVEGARHILDVGTGTGLVALMAAQRCTARVTALEIDAEAAAQARENVQASPWHDRVQVACANFVGARFDEPFDAILCNPPYFIHSLKSEGEQRTLARHATSLSCEQLLAGAASALAPQGSLSVIVPADQQVLWQQTAPLYGLYPRRLTLVSTTPASTPKRLLLTLTRDLEICEKGSLTLENGAGGYSEEFRLLVKDFYLKL